MASVLTRGGSAEVRPHLITADELLALVRQDALDGRVELIDGELIDVPPQSQVHLRVKALLARLIDNALGQRANLLVVQDGGLKASELSVPEPDIMVWEADDEDRFVTASQVRLVVEVCLTSHRRDFGRKVGLYASADIPEYWIVDLASRSIAIMWSPANGAYRERGEAAVGGDIRSHALDITIPTAQLARQTAPS